MITTASFTSRLDGLFTQDIDAAVLAAAVVEAVAYYSRYNPRYIRTQVDVVDETELYNVPDDFLTLDWFDWWPTGEPAAEVLATDEPWEAAYKIRLGEAKALRASPYVRVIGGQFVLNPAPTADADDVEIAYYGLHLVVESNYPTIPTADESILLKLAVAELLDLRTPQIAVTPDVTEGLLALQWRKVPMNTSQTISLLRKPLKDKYGGH